jgi:K+-sensing histidine kinase KdpD
MNRKYNILYVDDEISNLNIFKNTFRRSYNIFTAESANEGLKILDHEPIDLILTDQRMPEMNGVEFLKNVIVKYPQPNRILITAFTDFDALKDAINEAKIFQYVQKPWDEKDIQQVIDDALELYQLRQKNIQLTEQLRLSNDELVRINNELIELDQLKMQFLNIISHELRTPLNWLTGALNLMKLKFTQDEYEKFQEYFQILDDSVNRLQDFLLLAVRITAFKANRNQVQPSLFNFSTLVNKAVKSLDEKVLKKNISIQYDLMDDKDCYADKELMEVCIREIVDNAIKYSFDDGKVSIRYFHREKNNVFEVTDHGQGFPETVLRNKFKAFIAGDAYVHQGTGLDLVLINMVMDAHKGQLECLNAPEGGAIVRLVF